MESLSRRSMLRLVGGAAGASGIAGASLLTPSYAGRSRSVRASLNRATYRRGQRMKLRIAEDVRYGGKIRVIDSRGRTWRRVEKTRTEQVWATRAGAPGDGVVRVVMEREDGSYRRSRVYRDRLRYQVVDEGSVVTGPALIGMSAPSSVWDERVAEVGAGLTARRIFADLAKGPTSQLKTVKEAHAAGMLPVISYKVGNDINGAMNGRFNAVAEEAAAELAALGKTTAVAFWHEPNPDVTGAEYTRASLELLPIFKEHPELRVGPILNGWLLDNQQELFGEYCPDELLEVFDWFGIDTYEGGSASNPGKRKPADRIYALADYLASRGSDLPLAVGEYNGWSAETVAAAGEALMTVPNVWFGCVWNSTGDRFYPLEGARLEAFRQTLRDPRSADRL